MISLGLTWLVGLPSPAPGLTAGPGARGELGPIGTNLGSEGLHPWSAAATRSAPGPAVGPASTVPLQVVMSPLNATWVVDQNISFKAYVSGGSGSNFSYLWQFGDGSNGSGWWVGHRYSTFGTFPVSVRVTDDLNDSGSASTTISIYNVTFVSVRLWMENSSVAPPGQFIVHLTPQPECGAHTPPNCTTNPVSLALNLRVNNSSASPYATYDVDDLLPGVNASYAFPAPYVGPWVVSVLMDPPWFAGLQLLHITVVPPLPSPQPTPSAWASFAPYAVLVYGSVLLLAVAAGSVFLGWKQWIRLER